MNMTSVNSAKTKSRIRIFPIFLTILLALSVFFFFNFQTVEVKGQSMMPTLKDGRRVLVTSAYWLVGEIKPKDIVVVREFTGKGYFIKRVHALGGTTVSTSFAPRTHKLTDGPFVVPPGMIHVIGDNLGASEDSRKFGPIEAKQILGKVIVWQ